jgi:hypothetical protein
MERVIFISNVFGPMSIPREAVSTFRSKHDSVDRLKEIGGIYATGEEAYKLSARIRRANRKIERNGWYSKVVGNKEMIDAMTAWKTKTSAV